MLKNDFKAILSAFLCLGGNLYRKRYNNTPQQTKQAKNEALRTNVLTINNMI